MFRTVANKLFMLLYFVVGALVLEALTFLVLDFGFMPEYFWYNFFLILVVGVTFFIIPNYTAQYVTYTVVLGIQAVLIYINYSLTRVYGDLLSIEMLRLIREAGNAMTSSFVYIAVILEIILVYVAIIAFGALVLKYCRKDKNTIKQHFSVFTLIIFLSAQLMAVGFSVRTREMTGARVSITDPSYALTDKFLMSTSILKTSSYIKFGTYGYYTNMITNAIENQQKEIETATIEYFDSGFIYGSDYGQQNSKYNYPVFGIDKGNNIIVIMMESLEWFGFGDGTYDSTFENLIYVDDQLQEKTFTPNITKLIYGEDYLTDLGNSNRDNDALIAKNFFAKSKTNMSEGQGIIGNYPIGQSLSDIVKKDAHGNSAFGYAMPHLMKEQGYTTSYVHSHDISFYSRGKTHSHLGFDNVVGKNNIKDKDGSYIYTKDALDFDNWDAEGRFAQNAIDHIVSKDRSKPFYTFYLNVSSHGAYDASDNKHDGDAERYYYYVKYGADDCVKDAETGVWSLNKPRSEATPTQWYLNVLENHASIAEDLVFYECGVIGLDDAIGVIINKLKEYDIYDETTMLLYSDHYAYYDSLSHDLKDLPRNDNNNQELNTIPMIISSPGIKKYNSLHSNLNDKFLINTRFTSAYDVVPTLLDLLGVPFNENFYLGHSMFRPADYVYEENEQMKDVVVYYSNTGGIFGDGIHTFDLSNYTTKENYKDSTLELFKSEAVKHLIKINFLTYLNRYNLYHKVKNV